MPAGSHPVAPSIDLGEVSVTRVVEWAGAIRAAHEILPDSDPATWSRHEAELAPEFWEPSTDAYRCAIQSWVLRSGGRTIVVDTGAGNDRDRPQVPQFDHLATSFLDDLAAAGVAPVDVDLVINTHVHYDHVGWNTRLVDGQWVPTFPNATYLIPRLDLEYFHPGNEHRRPAPRSDADRVRRRGSHVVYADSITPIVEAGLAVAWEEGYRIDEALAMRPAPGHTPGSSCLWLDSDGERAVFVGDLLHSPVQLFEPDVNSCFCEDPELARQTRRRVLGDVADTRSLLVPAHFPGHGAVHIETGGPCCEDAFTITEWAGFPALATGGGCRR